MKLKAVSVVPCCDWFTKGKTYNVLREYVRGSVIVLDDDKRESVHFPNDPLPGDYVKWEII